MHVIIGVLSRINNTKSLVKVAVSLLVYMVILAVGASMKPKLDVTNGHIPGVFPHKHVRLLAHVYVLLLYNVFQSREQILLLRVGQLGGVALPCWCHHLAHGVHQLHPVVLLQM